MDTYRANTRFLDVFQHYINRGLQKWVGKSLSRDAFAEIYEYVRKTVDELFSKTRQNYSEITKTWMSQKLYEAINIGSSTAIVTMPIVYAPTDIKKIPSDELRLIGGLLSDASFAQEIADELKRRN
jgi:hypothetical protein